MAEHEFTVYTDTHKATVGDIKYELQPEVETPDILAGMAAMVRKRRERDKAREAAGEGESELTPIEKMALDSKAATADLREFLSGLMVPDSQDVFAGKVYSDRVLVELQNWALETYGLRPTTSSNGSSQPSVTTPTPGDDSTAGLPSEESTP